MASGDLIDATRGELALSFDGSPDADAVAALISAASEAIGQFCRRRFASASYKHVLDGPYGDSLLLKEYPVTAVARVACGPADVLWVQNTSSANQRATAAVTSTGLSLTKVASGSSSTDASVTFSGNATLSAVAVAVNALGSGWAAAVASGFELWPSADLLEQGARDCAASRQAPLRMFVEEIPDFELYGDEGILLRECGWPRGRRNLRVDYTAGYATIPEDVKEACAQWVQTLYFNAQKDTSVTGTVPDSGASFTYQIWDRMPPRVKELLQPYRRRTRG